jgi:hypothetical protein
MKSCKSRVNLAEKSNPYRGCLVVTRKGVPHPAPGKLLVVIDQFEELVILQDRERQEPFEKLVEALRSEPFSGLSFLLVFRSD